jgi:two-component system sensor histidine kinase KdpD
MTRGRLRVLLGAAPGVGKTYSMLEEGKRLCASGKDVVVAVVETHGRVATSALLDGLEIIPRRAVSHRGVNLDEMDLDAVLARRPDLALVDELAHTNAPGSPNDKRWNDVEALLDAGIDVMSTVNIQHIESLGDVVHQITGVVQRETIPDAVLRRADQIELVDLAPQSLRDRLADGFVYPDARVDAALSNYFRLGNLTALRELALLWLADEVDVALQAYRIEHGIDSPWEARERIVVALTGGAEGETLLRRAARIAARSSGGTLFAVHVTTPDGLTATDPTALTEQRALVETLGGSFHQVVSERAAPALVDFARSVQATQLVIGVESIFGGAGTGGNVVRLAGDIDVHIVSHAQAGRQRLPRIGGALSLRRRLTGFAVAIVVLPVLTWLLAALPGEASITTDALGFQLVVVIVALIGGIWPAVVSAVLAGFLLDYFFVQPAFTLAVTSPVHLVALVFFLAVAILVSAVVDRAARRSRSATRSAVEAEILVTIAGSVIGGDDALASLVTRLREAFGMVSVVLRQNGDVVYSATDSTVIRDSDEETTLPIGSTASVYLRGRPLAPTDRRILGVFATQIEAALEQRRLTSETARMGPLAAADKLRSALLAAVGHDLRRPLGSATTAVTALRSAEGELSDTDREELLETAEESLAALTVLVVNLLDVSRLQAGALGVQPSRVALDGAVIAALDELHLAPGEVSLDLGPVRDVTADAGSSSTSSRTRCASPPPVPSPSSPPASSPVACN